MSGVMQVAHAWPPWSIGGVELYASSLFHELRALTESYAFSAIAAPLSRERTSTSAHAHRTGFPGGPCSATQLRELSSPQGADGLRLFTIHRHDTRNFRDTYIRPDVEAAFREWLLSRRPSVVHFHHLANLSMGLPRIAARSGALVVMTLHDYWLPCARGQMLDHIGRLCRGPTPHRCAACLSGQLALSPWTAALGRLTGRVPASWRARVREVLGSIVNGTVSHSAGNVASFRDSPPYPSARHTRAARFTNDRWNQALLVPAWVHRFLSPSAHLASRMLHLGVIQKPAQVMGLPLLQPIRPSPPPAPGPVRFLFIGALVASKGPQLLLEAFSRLPAGAATLRIVGYPVESDLDPCFRQRLEDRAMNLAGTTVEPPFPPGQVSRLLQESDVLVVPSLWHENSPLVVREARAAGLRVISSGRGGLVELLTGEPVFDPEDPESILGALRHEIRRGRERRRPVEYESSRQHAETLLEKYREWRLECTGKRDI